MQAAIGPHAQSANVTRVLRNLRFNKYNMKMGFFHLFIPPDFKARFYHKSKAGIENNASVIYSDHAEDCSFD